MDEAAKALRAYYDHRDRPSIPIVGAPWSITFAGDNIRCKQRLLDYGDTQKTLAHDIQVLVDWEALRQAMSTGPFFRRIWF
jgi:hypothetical protein